MLLTAHGFNSLLCLDFAFCGRAEEKAEASSGGRGGRLKRKRKGVWRNKEREEFKISEPWLIAFVQDGRTDYEHPVLLGCVHAWDITCPYCNLDGVVGLERKKRIQAKVVKKLWNTDPFVLGVKPVINLESLYDLNPTVAYGFKKEDMLP